VKTVIPVAALVLGLLLVVGWAAGWYGDWGTLITGVLLLGGGAFGLVDALAQERTP
jgi:hypothetical protein